MSKRGRPSERASPGTNAALAPWQNVVAFVVGAALLLAGGWAVINEGKDGAGVLAFIAVGALFVLVGVTGAVPTTLKIGGNEMQLSREIIEEVVRGRPIIEEVRQAQEAVALGHADKVDEALGTLAKPRSTQLAVSPLAREIVEYRTAALVAIPGVLPPEASLHAEWRLSTGRNIGPLIAIARTEAGSHLLIGVDAKIEADDDFVRRVRRGPRSLTGLVNGFLLLVERPRVTARTGTVGGVRTDGEGLPLAIINWRPGDDPTQLSKVLAELLRTIE